MDEYTCQRRLLEVLGIPDEQEVNLQKDPRRRLRLLARLNEAKACLRVNIAKAGITGTAIELAVAELSAPEYRVQSAAQAP